MLDTATKPLTRITSFIILLILLVTVGLLLTLDFVNSSIQAKTINFGPSVDVAATAQAIRTHNREVELKTSLQIQQAAREIDIAKKQQALTTFNNQAQTQINTRQANLLTLQRQINQAEADLSAIQMEIAELQRGIQTDNAQLATINSNIAQTTGDIATLQGQLQAAQAALTQQQSAIPPSALQSAGVPADTPPDSASDSHFNEDDHKPSEEEDKQTSEKNEDKGGEREEEDHEGEDHEDD